MLHFRHACVIFGIFNIVFMKGTYLDGHDFAGGQKLRPVYFAEAAFANELVVLVQFRRIVVLVFVLHCVRGPHLIQVVEYSTVILAVVRKVPIIRISLPILNLLRHARHLLVDLRLVDVVFESFHLLLEGLNAGVIRVNRRHRTLVLRVAIRVFLVVIVFVALTCTFFRKLIILFVAH